ncbi:Petrobactin-binding protein FpuA [Paraconexibacter sp. AEG42_29]|uniref:Petrobactin-binding protein FpuA n=1 Tax=Paraconexibacter sp. AEG42_29 TaxID=2997339 RepID=A0AAU7B2N5_9ACTN
MRLPAVLMSSLLAVGLVAASTATAEAAPKRVVALEWEYLEDVARLGVKPVGGADLRGYRTYVSISLPSGITDVGTRQQPNIERIAKLRPDLIIVPKWRVGKNLSQLKRIAKVLVLNPYPGDQGSGTQYKQMVSAFRAIGSALGRSSRANRIIRDLDAAYPRLRKRLAKANRDGVKIAVAQPAGTASSPQVRLFTRNSVAGSVLNRLGLRNSWSDGDPKYGFSTAGIESLKRVQSGYFAFVYPNQFESLIKKFQKLRSYKSLTMVKKKRVRYLRGNSWTFGGPASTKLLAYRIVDQLVKK